MKLIIYYIVIECCRRASLHYKLVVKALYIEWFLMGPSVHASNKSYVDDIKSYVDDI
jgi:hypothetical protein